MDQVLELPPRIEADCPWVVNPKYTKETSDVEPYYITMRCEMDVLSIHFQTQTMRVRVYMPDGKPRTCDMSATEFFNSFSLVRK